jgi:muconolactone delta-isomerase
MQFMVTASRNPTNADAPIPAELREMEFQKIRELYSEGLIRNIWLRADGPGACLLVEAGSKEEVEEKLAALPYIHAGILAPPTIIPLKPYAGFGPRAPA